MIELKNTERKASPADLSKTEQVLGREFPWDYREFLQEFNGGVPESNIFNFAHHSQGFSVSRFFGIGLNSSNDLMTRQNVFKGRLPKDFLPIADASGGNLVCISLSNHKYGSIYFWNHELESENDLSSALTEIAQSFDAFLASLEVFDPKQIQLKPGQITKAWIRPRIPQKRKN